MKLLAVVVFIFSTSIAFSADFFDLNLSKGVKPMMFSLYDACDSNPCLGVELTVPKGARVLVVQENSAICSIQPSAALEYKGGDTYIIETQLQQDTNESCRVSVRLKNSKKSSVIRLVNMKVTLE